MGKDHLRWSLEALYPSLSDPTYREEEAGFKQAIDQVVAWTGEQLQSYENGAEKLTAYLEKSREIRTAYMKLFVFPYLMKSVDAKNGEAAAAVGRIETKYAEFKTAEVRFSKWLKGLEGLEELIQTTPFLEEHRFSLNEMKDQASYMLSDQEELIISKMSVTGAKAWASVQQVVASTLLVEMELDGRIQSLPLPVVRNMAFEGDQALRKKAYEAELAAYSKIIQTSAAALNGIKGEVLTVSKLKGYESPLEMTLKTSRMSKETLNALLEAIRESLPAFRRFFKKKAELLGHQGGLPFYDLFAPMGTAEGKYTFEEAVAYVAGIFGRFSENLGNYAKKAYEDCWIDVEPREGKQGGAFCYNIHPLGQSRFLLNFTGELNNVITLAHELGHGFHGECLREESLLNGTYPMPLAETASTFAETVLVRDVMETGTPEEQFTVLENSLTHAGQIIVDIYSRYLFESRVFAAREDHQLSVEEINGLMAEAQLEAYGDGLDPEVIHPYMWINKVHYFFAERHFYNFPYAFGQLFAKGLYAQYVKQPEGFPEKYEALLRETGKQTVEGVARLAGIDLTTVDFWRSSLKLIEEEIEQFISLAESNQ